MVNARMRKSEKSAWKLVKRCCAKMNDEEYKEPSVCDNCEIGDGWECQFCCNKCYEDYGECPNPNCDLMDI